MVAVGKRIPLVDPGSDIYTRRTFSRDRYKSGVLNSWGHPVPRVASNASAVPKIGVCGSAAMG